MKSIYVLLLFAAISMQGQISQGMPDQVAEQGSVQVFLTAALKSGSAVALDTSGLSVSVDKQPARVSTLRPAKSDPLLFAVLVDASRSDASTADSVKKVALQLFLSLSKNGNRGYLVLFNHSATISKAPLQVSQVQAVLDAVKFDGGTAVYDAIEQTCNGVLSESGNPGTPRRAILLISDGEDNSSHVTKATAEEAADREGVAIFTLVTRSSLSGPEGEHALQEMSRRTGGLAVVGRNLADGIAPLLASIENQWALTLVPAKPLDQKSHSLNVRTSQRDVSISAPAYVSASQ